MISTGRLSCHINMGNIHLLKSLQVLSGFIIVITVHVIFSFIEYSYQKPSQYKTDQFGRLKMDKNGILEWYVHVVD